MERSDDRVTGGSGEAPQCRPDLAPAPAPSTPPVAPLRLQPWPPSDDAAGHDGEPLGGEPPCMVQLLDEDGRMPDSAPRLTNRG